MQVTRLDRIRGGAVGIMMAGRNHRPAQVGFGYQHALEADQLQPGFGPLGTRAEGRCTSHSGHITGCVVPSYHSVLGFSSACLEAAHCTRSRLQARALREARHRPQGRTGLEWGLQGDTRFVVTNLEQIPSTSTTTWTASAARPRTASRKRRSGPSPRARAASTSPPTNCACCRPRWPTCSSSACAPSCAARHRAGCRADPYVAHAGPVARNAVVPRRQVGRSRIAQAFDESGARHRVAKQQRADRWQRRAGRGGGSGQDHRGSPMRQAKAKRALHTTADGAAGAGAPREMKALRSRC